MSKEQEKKFLDRESLKQAFVLIKSFVRDNFVSKADYQSGSATSDQALTDAKTELNATITATKAEIEADLETAETELNSTIEANKSASEEADKALQANVDAVAKTASDNLADAKKALEGADTALGERIDALTSTLNTTKIKFAIVDALPEAKDADERTIYLIKNEEADRTADEKNIYIEYMFINGKFEEIGDTQLSLDDYDTKAEVTTKVADAKAEALQATANAKSEALAAVTSLEEQVQENDYVKSDNFITAVEVQALFAEAPLMVDADGNVTAIDDIETAVTTAPSGTTIVLGKDVTVAAGTEVAEGITLDLNGFTLKIEEA